MWQEPWFGSLEPYLSQKEQHFLPLLQEQVTLPGGRAHGEMDSLPKVSETNGRCTYTQGEDFSWPKGQGSPQGADVL